MNEKSNDRLALAKRKLRELTRSLTGVEGWGTDGESLRVYVSAPTSIPAIPREVDGFAVRVVSSGEFHAQAG